MITFVNTVLVGKGTGAAVDASTLLTVEALKALNAGDYVVETDDADAPTAFKVGMVTSTKNAGVPVINWSNMIPVASIKHAGFNTYVADDPETIKINFSAVDADTIAEKNVVLRLTFKDLPTRYRKWTESYMIQTVAGETNVTLAQKFADKINGVIRKKNEDGDDILIPVASDIKRARVEASVSGAILTLTAMEYDDDNTADSISPANTVRFSANMWLTDPKAAGFASKNKYSVDGVKIEKTPGKIYAGSAKLVRDLEAQAMGYRGILNRGECTWPIIKPDMNTNIDANYNILTIEFEPAYHAADDIVRKTKQTLQIFDYSTAFTAIKGAIEDAGVTFVEELSNTNAGSSAQ